jgi:hypothetical protein
VWLGARKDDKREEHPLYNRTLEEVGSKFCSLTLLASLASLSSSTPLDTKYTSFKRQSILLSACSLEIISQMSQLFGRIFLSQKISQISQISAQPNKLIYIYIVERPCFNS